MIPEILAADFPQGNPHEGKHDACARATVVISISECTRRDLLAIYGDLDLEVVVVPHGVDAERFRAESLAAEDNTILFVGSRSGYKDFGTFAVSTARLLAEAPNLWIVCIGGGALRSEELAPFVALGVQRRVVQCAASDEDLPGFYRRALAFVFPSRYEGFGLPILEAFACRCPVILSRASCFPEIADDAAEYFEPGNAEGLLEALRRVVFDPSRRRALRRLGALRLQNYTWNRSAELTAAVYRRAIEKLH